MPFARPTINEIADRVQQDIASRLSLLAPLLRRSMAYVFGRVIAGAVHMLHGHVEFLSRQVFPDLSDGEFLVRQAGLYGLARIPAAYATGDVTFTGTGGAVAPAGTVLLRADGTRYVTGADATIGGTVTVAATASVAGADGNATAGVLLSVESPIAGIDSTVTVAVGGLVSGADEETDAALRIRLLERIQSPPHGGAASDYVRWCKEVAGVTRAWCYPLEGGAGTVTVRFVRDNDADFIPDAGEVTAVQDHIDAVRPVTAVVTVAAPIADALNFTIHISPDTAAIRAAVQAELADYLLRVSEPGVNTLRSQLLVAIGNADGVDDFTLTAPAADVVHATGHIAKMGAITWT